MKRTVISLRGLRWSPEPTFEQKDHTAFLTPRLVRYHRNLMPTPVSERAQRHFTRKEIERLTAWIDDSSLRGVRDRAMIWLGYEGNLRPSRLVLLLWRHVEFSEFDATIKILGRSAKFTKVLTLDEHSETLAAMRSWYEVRPRRSDEPVFASVHRSDKRVSSTALRTGEVGRIVTKRALEAGLGEANGKALIRVL